MCMLQQNLRRIPVAIGTYTIISMKSQSKWIYMHQHMRKQFAFLRFVLMFLSPQLVYRMDASKFKWCFTLSRNFCNVSIILPKPNAEVNCIHNIVRISHSHSTRLYIFHHTQTSLVEFVHCVSVLERSSNVLFFHRQNSTAHNCKCSQPMRLLLYIYIICLVWTLI